jgi:hypothetical protein
MERLMDNPSPVNLRGKKGIEDLVRPLRGQLCAGIAYGDHKLLVFRSRWLRPPALIDKESSLESTSKSKWGGRVAYPQKPSLRTAQRKNKRQRLSCSRMQMVSIDHFRQELLAQMSRAATQGRLDILVN